MMIFKEGKQRLLDSINLVLGLALFLSPWVLGFAAERVPAWNAWVSGAAVGVVAAVALAAFAEWEEWLNLALGVWIALSPWLLGFAGIAGALWAHVILGVVVAAVAAGELWLKRQSPPGVTA